MTTPKTLFVLFLALSCYFPKIQAASEECIRVGVELDFLDMTNNGVIANSGTSLLPDSIKPESFSNTLLRMKFEGKELASEFPLLVARVETGEDVSTDQLLQVFVSAIEKLKAENDFLQRENETLQERMFNLEFNNQDLEKDVHSLQSEMEEMQVNMAQVLNYIESIKLIEAADH